MAVKAKDNPFAADKVEGLKFRLGGLRVEDVLVRLVETHFCGAIAGPHGSGKTTLMLEMSEQLVGRGVEVKSVFVNDTNPWTRGRGKELLADLRAGQVVMLDGADTLRRFAWRGLERKIIKAGVGLVITTHRLGMMNTLVESSTSERLLAEIVGELIGDPKAAPEDLVREIYRRCNGNIRNCLWQMYDIWAMEGKLSINS
jgi:hypothetical protein